MSATPLSTVSSSQSPLVYFLAGALVPSLAWFFLRPKTTPAHVEDFDDDEEDEDIADTTVGGPSSKWGYTDAPYKVSLCERVWKYATEHHEPFLNVG